MKFFHNFCLENPVSLDMNRSNLSPLFIVKFYPGILSRLRSILIRNPQENLSSFKLTRSVHVLGFMIIQRHPAKELILKLRRRLACMLRKKTIFKDKGNVKSYGEIYYKVRNNEVT